MTTEYAGIDYGRGATNIDAETGIRYGVIPQGAVLQAWADSSEPHYGEQQCSKCAATITMDDSTCPECGVELDPYGFDFVEPVSFYVDDDEYSAECGDNGDIFITRSPFFTFAQFCSPCAPGAGYLENELSEPNPNNRAYCFGHDWFDEGRAPYTVYRVATGEVVSPS